MDIPTHPDALLSMDQVAYLLGVDVRTVKRWRQQGSDLLPPAMSLNGKIRWRMATVSEWIRRVEILSEEKNRGTIGDNRGQQGTNGNQGKITSGKPSAGG